MFVCIDDNYLKMNRGDSYILPILINEGTKLNFQQYQLRQFDKIYVGIIEMGQSFEDAIIRKVIDIFSKTDSKGHPLFMLKPEDTEYLLTGKYYIEMKLVQKIDEQDFVTTILPLKEFFINGTNKEVKPENTYIEKQPLSNIENESSWESINSDVSSHTEQDNNMTWVQIS